MAVPEGFTVVQSSLPEGFQIIPPSDSGEEERLGFAQRFGQDIQKRVDMLGEIQRAVQSGEQSTAEGVLQVAGKLGAGAILDFIGEGVTSAGRLIADITPESIKDPLVKAGYDFLETDIGKKGVQAAQRGMEGWDFFKNENPRAARNIEAVMNVGMLIAPAKGAKPAPKSPGIAGRVASTLDDAAIAQEAATKESFAEALVQAKPTQGVRVDQVSRTSEGGLLNSKTVTPSSAEQRMAEAVASVPEVSPTLTLQGNYNAVSNAVRQEADDLMRTLEESGAKISHREATKTLDLAGMRLEQMPTLVGDASTSAKRIIAEAKRIVKDSPETSAGMLKARRRLDEWIRSQKPKAFDPATENAMSLAVKEVRQSINFLVEAKNPQQAVRQSLSRQSSLLGAMDNIAVKAADEGSNALVRAWQNVSRIIPLRGEFNQTAATLFGIGGLGAAAKFAPYFTKLLSLGVATYVGGRLVMSPAAKRGAAMILRRVDDALSIATDKEMIQQLRADRAAIKELLDSSAESIEASGKE